MIRVIALKKGSTCGVTASGAPCHLSQHLKGSLGRTRISRCESKICIHDADKGEIGKMMTLRDELSANHDVEFTRGHRFDLSTQSFNAARHIGRQDKRTRFGKLFGDFFLQSFNARTACR